MSVENNETEKKTKQWIDWKFQQHSFCNRFFSALIVRKLIELNASSDQLRFRQRENASLMNEMKHDPKIKQQSL